MKNKFVFAGLLIAVLAAGIMVMGCASTEPAGPPPDLTGSWGRYGPNGWMIFTFSGNTYTYTRDDGRSHKGTYEQTTSFGSTKLVFHSTEGFKKGTMSQTYKLEQDKLTMPQSSSDLDYGSWAKFDSTAGILEGNWLNSAGDLGGRRLIVKGNVFAVVAGNDSKNVRNYGSFVLNNPASPTEISFSNVNDNWKQACSLSGTTFTLQQRTGEGTQNIIGGTYVKQ